MADRLEGANQLNEVQFQSPIDSFPHRDNYSKITAVIASHAAAIEALSTAASGSEVVDARNDEPDLNTRITKADEIQGDGVFEAVLNEYLMKESAAPDDKLDVDTGEALINGRMARTATVQTVDPPNFTAVSKERIDTMYLKSDGTVDTVTGAEVALGAGTAEAESPPNNTVILGFMFLRSGAANPSPFAPEDIRDTDDLTDSFIIPNLQRFFVQRDRTDAERHPSNLLANGAFATVNSSSVLPPNWTETRGALIQDATAANVIFGDNAGKFTGDGVTGGNYIEQELLSPKALRGKFVTLSAHLKLDAATASKVGRISIIQVGDTPEQDFVATADLNAEQFQRLSVSGLIDNSVTQVFVRIEVDTTDMSTVVGFIDGVQCSVGKILTDFEWPERIRRKDDGTVELTGGITFVLGTTTTFAGAVVFTGTSTTTHESGSLETYEAGSDLVLDGTTKGNGDFDTEEGIWALVAMGD